MSTERLQQLYNNTSKHSNYQVLASSLKGLLPSGDLTVKSRLEVERLGFMSQHIDFTGDITGDIGGNTGFFTFEMIDRGAQEVHYFEGNDHHAKFVTEAASQLSLSDRIHVNHGYFMFDKPSLDSCPKFNTLLLLNVLHHVGDDYGDQKMSVDRALKDIKESLRNIAQVTDTLIIQLGFNWKGDRNLPLFENGTKSELIEFVSDSVSGVWNIGPIGIPERQGDTIVYADQSSTNLARDDSLGEFLNRPLFILTRV